MSLPASSHYPTDPRPPEAFFRAAEALPVPLRERACHVITENNRVLEACGDIDAARFGAPMNDSHASLRDDHEVSIPALDELTELLRKDPAEAGARLTGAGFGGACVALCRTGTAAAAGRRAVTRVNAAGAAATLLIPASTPPQDHKKRGSDE
ncbi:hypothetical protein [Massilia sp. METH4]|uniref:hypothetical protein n=1 Tax=Massilia sp. METH4 TaxID=3123041 RepID=UPI0030D11347